MRKIIICSTFREFNGNSNDAIQRLFLESLASQTYTNWELVATVYKEKNVASVLDEMGIKNQIFYSKLNDCRFSLTEVLLNGMKGANKGNEDIIVWTTCDVIFEKNFFQTLSDNFSHGMVGTSHPHLIASSIQEYNNGNSYGRLDEGIDTVFFDASLLLDKNIAKVLKTYEFKDWGIFEHFLVGVGAAFAKEHLNLWSLTKIYKIANDRKVNLETSEYLNSSWNRNFPVLQQFIQDYRLNPALGNLYFCHTQFKPRKPWSLFVAYAPEYIRHEGSWQYAQARGKVRRLGKTILKRVGLWPQR